MTTEPRLPPRNVLAEVSNQDQRMIKWFEDVQRAVGVADGAAADIGTLEAEVTALEADLVTGLAGKADLVHTHAIADVLLLQVALDGKATAAQGALADTALQAGALIPWTDVTGKPLFTDVGDGLTPASGGGTANFLRADGTWAAPSGGGGAVAWGAITGTLADQTDLQAELDGKLDEGAQIDLPEVTPVTPAADHIGLLARSVGGRMLPGCIGPSGLITPLQPFLGRNKVGMSVPHGNGTTINTWGVSLGTTGTATPVNVATTNIFTSMRSLEYAVTVASTSAVAGIRSGAGLQYFLGDTTRTFGGFMYVCRFGRLRGVAANATLRAYNGMTSLNSAPTDVDPSTTVTNAIGVGCDAADTNWQIIHRNVSAAATKIDTGFAKAVGDSTEMYELSLFAPPGVLGSVGYQFKRLSDEAMFEGTITTNLPAATTLLSFRNYYSVGGTSSVIGYAHCGLYIETDY